MDAEAFLAAQLWLRAVPFEAWPRGPTTTTTSTNATASAAEGRGGIVILDKAKCGFLLENRPSVAAASSAERGGDGAGRSGSSGSFSSSNNTAGGSRRSPSRPLYFSTRSAAGAAAATATAATADDNRSLQTRHQAGTGSGGSLVSDLGSHRGRSCAVSVPAEDRDGNEQSAAATAAPMAGLRKSEPAPLICEFDFGLAIARGDAATERWRGHAAQSNADAESGTLLLRLENKIYQAEHTLIRSIAYPRSVRESRGASNAREEKTAAPKPPAGVRAAPWSAEDVNSSGGSGSGGAAGERPTAAALDKAFRPDAVRPSSTASVAVGAAAAAAAAVGTKRAVDTSGDGAAGTADTGSGRGSDGRGRRPEGVAKRGRFDDGYGISGTAAAAAAAVETGGGEYFVAGASAAHNKRSGSNDSEHGVGVRVPFCGLFFPGVLLKFWLPLPPSKEIQSAAAAASAGADAVSRLQGVVSDMLAGLSPTPRRDIHLGGGAVGSIPEPGFDDQVRSVVSEGQEDGFRRRFEAWDEFMYGTCFLFRGEPASDPRRRDDGRGGGGSGGGDPGVAMPPPIRGQCISERVCVNASAFPGLSASGEGLSDGGRARALTCLAECFSGASLPSLVKQSAQQRLQEAATCAGRELEDALDRALPLDLSQGTDNHSRAFIVSELTAALDRVQTTRQAAFAVTLLPSSEMLDGAASSA